MTSEEAAYLAGFIDVDGCITIVRNKNVNGAYLYRPYILFMHTNKGVLDWISLLVEAGTVLSYKGLKDNHKARHTLRLSRNDSVRRILPTIYPHLQIKHKQADLVMEFIDSRSDAKIVTGRGAKGKTSYTERELEIYKEIRVLNKRGI